MARHTAEPLVNRTVRLPQAWIEALEAEASKEREGTVAKLIRDQIESFLISRGYETR